MRYQIMIDASNPMDKKVIVAPATAALEDGYTKVSEFDHGDAEDPTDTLPRHHVSHVIYHHVQDALYFIKNHLVPIQPGFWPDNITDMQTVSISMPDPVAVTGVTVAPTTATVAVGATQQLTPTVAPAGATNKAVTYSTSDATKATVNASGLVTGVAAGSANITVTTADGAKTAVCAVTVE